MNNSHKNNKDIIISKLYTIILLIAAFLMLACYFGTSQHKEDKMIIIKPCGLANLADGSTEYFFNLSEYDYHNSGLMFYTAHQKVEVFNKGKQIYSFTKTGGMWTSSTGAKYHFIDINPDMHFISVKINPIYEVVADQVPEFYIGSSYGMYNSILLDSLPRFVTSLLILMLSLAILGYYAIMHKKQHLTKELLYLGWLTFFCGLWSINETDFATLVFTNKIINSILPYICLMLVIPPFIMFFDSYLNIYGKVFKKIIIWAALIQFISLTTLHALKIVEFRESLIIMQVMLVFAALYMVIGLFVQLAKRRITKHIEICAAGLSVFTVSCIVDIIHFYNATGDADKIGRYIFFIFIFILARDMIADANEIITKGNQVKQLEIFALTDSMTGLLNRNAFESHVDSNKNLEGVVAVVADANGLKQCNDTFGHEAGDEYITLVAEIFNEVYGKYGNCYRTGGDEFCCIIPANHSVNTDRLKQVFLTKIYTANMNGSYDYNIGVAIGDACYDSNKDEDFRALVKRADADMYENKRAAKSS